MPTQYTRADAARLLKISISTLDRKIARGELETVTEPFGARERVYVLLEDPPPQADNPGNTTEITTGNTTGNTTEDIIAPYVRILEDRLQSAQDLAEYRHQLLTEADARLQMVLHSLGTAHTTIEALTRSLPAPEPPPAKAKRTRGWLAWWKR